MKTPLCHAVVLGELTPWGKHFTQGLHEHNLIEFHHESSLDAYLSFASNMDVGHLWIENSSEGRRTLEKVRSLNRQVFIVIFGRLFSKEDISFAFEHRVYCLFENVTPETEKVSQKIKNISEAIDRKKQFDLVTQSIKAILLQLSGDVTETQLNEFKAALNRIESLGEYDEWVGGPRSQDNTEEQSKMLFHAKESFSGIIQTINQLERTGVLWVRGRDEEEGRIDFLQGRIISASANDVKGMKAIYRIFLWDDPKFIFVRRDAQECEVDEIMRYGVKYICTEGEHYQKRFEKIRKEIPPKDLCLELEPTALHSEVALSHDDFSVLCSVIEHERVALVLNYSSLPDVIVYEGLIRLRKNNTLRIL